ncbi:MAG: class I SAM-dependent methyltransferase [Gammaproteobacteria bacterium]|nr:class I SAM-dependent methyltransferase [Gammaproteobacteria bacterium]
MKTEGVAVSWVVEAERERAAYWARELDLPLLAATDKWPALVLITDATGLELRQTGEKAPGPVRVDFVSGSAAHRRRFGGGRGQPLARAVGLRRGRLPGVLDATAGLGQDGFVLASLGCAVTLLERSPIAAALLSDGIDRAMKNDEIRTIAGRMELHCVDGSDYLRQLSRDCLPDVVYLDPMYPHRHKSALVKKEMRLFRHLVGDDADSAELLETAVACARFRVVVKRPAGAERLSDRPTNAQIQSTNTRYDIYINQGFKGRGKK